MTSNKIFPVISLFLIMIGRCYSQEIPAEFIEPPREFSVMPFWFWNDTLKDEEIIRQIADFEAHGVYGFVIHPRIGLPQSVEWLSPGMIRSMRIAIEEASRRKMFVILYDEGMYPSGSSSGQVVARNPDHAARCLSKIDLKQGEEADLPENSTLVATVSRPDGSRMAVIDKPSGGVIRGLHYIGEGSGVQTEESPPAGDILNPDAVRSFMELVYERYAREFGSFFGSTILGIFTDEPSPLGRGSSKGAIPGNARLIERINTILGYDFTPYLADLWYEDRPDSHKRRSDYYRAVAISLEEIYYRPLSGWCRSHGISLMGHPAGSMDIGTEKYFQVPGQDLVWRYVEPGPKALEGPHSTMAKCASSAMVHLQLRRNSNELYGAYGHNLTFDEMKWLADWCFVRGQNLLYPHAFYYSIRGPRYDERPPDVGPNAPWWKDYKPFADACRRLCWLNTDSRQVCSTAILCEGSWLPYYAAKMCFRNQIDFNYLEISDLVENAMIDTGGIHIAGMYYRALLIDSLTYLPEKALPMLISLAENGRLFIREGQPLPEKIDKGNFYKESADLITRMNQLIPPDIKLNPPSGNIRCRHVIKGENHYYILFNEDETSVSTMVYSPVKGQKRWLDPSNASAEEFQEKKPVQFMPHELKILWAAPTNKVE